jgi:hypothetical protein
MTRQVWTLSLSILMALAACGDADVSLPSQDVGSTDDDGSHVDSTVADSVSGDSGSGSHIVCGPGTQLDPSGTMCVPVVAAGDNVTTCPEGYMPSSSAGETLVCVPVMPVTVHGFVTDSQTGSPVVGAIVKLYPGLAEEIVTGDDGYFRVDGLPYSGQMKAVYSADEYEVSELDLILPFESGDGIKVLLVDASVSLKSLPGSGPVLPTEGEGWLSGTVYAGLGPANGVPVYLENDTLGEDVSSVLTNASGEFSLTDIAAQGYSFTLRVSPWDADGDGVYDYQGESIGLGDILAGNGSVNLSNIVVVLEPVQKYLAFVNLLPNPGYIWGPGLHSGLNFPDPNADLVLHFGAEVDVDTLDVSLVEAFGFGASIGETLEVNTSWNAAGTALSINPAVSLNQDADPLTYYRLHINGLLWADGSPFVPLDSGMGSGLILEFDLPVAPTYLDSPTPSIFVGNLVDEDQAVAQMSCDSRACWLLDPFGYPFNGPNDPSVNAPADCFFNGSSGFQLTWSGIPGAAQYNVYARQSYDGATGENLKGWKPVWSSISSGFTDPIVNATIYATQVLKSGNGYPGWDSFGVGAQGGQVGNPLAFDNVLEIAVTSVDESGFESAINDSKTLLLSDFNKVRIQQTTEVNGGAVPQKGETELGDTGIEKVFDIRFSELVDTTSTVTFEVRGGKVISVSSPAFTSWDPSQVGTAENASDEARFGPVTFDFSGVCSQVVAPAETSDSVVSLYDTSLFEAGGEVFFLNSGGSGFAHNGTRQVLGFDNGTQTIELTTTLEESNLGTIPAGAFACLLGPVLDQSTNITEGADSGETFIAVADQRPFHPNQKITIISLDPDPVIMTATVLRVSPAELAPQGFVLEPARLDITPSMQFTRDSAIVLPRPLGAEHTFRHAQDLLLSASVVTGDEVDLPLTSSSMESSQLLEGDLMLVDVDGNWDTILDRYPVAVGTVDMDQNSGEFNVGIQPAPGKLFGLPSGLTLTQGGTRVVWLGDSFKLSGISDTSGNSGFNEFGDEFSFCSAGLAGCEAGVFTY